MNKEKFIRVVLPLVISAVIIILFCIQLFAGVKQTNDTVVHEAGKKLQLDVTDYFDVNEETAASITLDTSMVDVNIVGSYEVTASYKMHKYTITVEVKDTQAPSVSFLNRYGFTNDITKMDVSEMVEGVYDASEYTLKLVRFEKSGSLSVMTEKTLKELTDAIPLPCNQETLKNLGTTEIPTAQGIYKAVLAVSDAYGNTQLEQVYVILDTTGAAIEDVPDTTVTVSADKLSEEPEVDTSVYVITDNVDGRVASEDITYEVELRDAEKHEWLVHVSYVDRAGNNSIADFLIIVKEEEKKVESNNQNTSNNTSADSSNTSAGTSNGNSDSSSSNKNNSNSSNTSGSNNSSSNSSNQSNNSQSSSSSGGSSSNSSTTSTGGYNSVTGEAYNSEQQAVIDAGLGVVVDYGDGSYGVLTDENYCVNGKDGYYILTDYLKELGLEPVVHKMGGAIIDADNGYYIYYVNEVRVIIGPDDPEYWESNAWYYDEENNIMYDSYEDYINGDGIKFE